jgi:hypothetical protein
MCGRSLQKMSAQSGQSGIGKNGCPAPPKLLSMTPDEQEALSLKHSRSLSILALASGKFALFFPWSNDGGMPLAKIAEWAELEAEVRAWRDKAEPQSSHPTEDPRCDQPR